jgi:hypothetical protein
MEGCPTGVALLDSLSCELVRLVVAKATAFPSTILSMATTCSAFREAVLEACGVETLFQLTVYVAGHGDIRDRVHTIQRAIASDLFVKLYFWPPQSAEPRPSPLREFEVTGPLPHLVVAYALPVENTLLIRAQAPIDNTASEGGVVKVIDMWSGHGNRNTTAVEIDQIETVPINHGAYYLFGKSASPHNVLGAPLSGHGHTPCCHVEVMIVKTL